MARVIAALIRHGDYHQLPQTPSAHQPFPLTETGRQQALTAATALWDRLQQERWHLHPELDCSRLLRAWQTADLMCQWLIKQYSESQYVESQPFRGHPIRLHQTEALAERGLGSAANLTVSAIEAVLQQDPRFSPPPADWKSNSHYCLPLQGAESLMQAGERVAYHLGSRMEQLAGQATVDTLQVFVGHGAAFRHGAHLLGVLPFEQIARLSMYHGVPVYLEYHGDGRWSHVGGNWKVRSAAEGYHD